MHHHHPPCLGFQDIRLQLSSDTHVGVKKKRVCLQLLSKQICCISYGLWVRSDYTLIELNGRSQLARKEHTHTHTQKRIATTKKEHFLLFASQTFCLHVCKRHLLSFHLQDVFPLFNDLYAELKLYLFLYILANYCHECCDMLHCHDVIRFIRNQKQFHSFIQ